MEIKPLDCNLGTQSLGGQRTGSIHSGEPPAPVPATGPSKSIPNSIQVTLSDASRMLLETEQTAAPIAKGEIVLPPTPDFACYEVVRTKITNFLNTYTDLNMVTDNQIKLFFCGSAIFLLNLITEIPLVRTQKAVAFATAGVLALTAAIKSYSEET